MFDAVRSSFGSKFTSVKSYWKAEREKPAITVRMIIEPCATDEIRKAEAKILLDQQKLAFVTCADSLLR